MHKGAAIWCLFDLDPFTVVLGFFATAGVLVLILGLGRNFYPSFFGGLFWNLQSALDLCLDFILIQSVELISEFACV